MICNGCKKEVAQDMRFAISKNACPFCGDSILTNEESVFRNSVSRVLIRNGLENEKAIDNISNQILSVFQSATTAPSKKISTSRANDDDDDDDDDDIGEVSVREMDEDDENFGPSEEDIRIANEDKVLFTEQPSQKAEKLRQAARARQKLVHNPVRRQE